MKIRPFTVSAITSTPSDGPIEIAWLSSQTHKTLVLWVTEGSSPKLVLKGEPKTKVEIGSQEFYLDEQGQYTFDPKELLGEALEQDGETFSVLVVYYPNGIRRSMRIVYGWSDFIDNLEQTPTLAIFSSAPPAEDK